jgi:hypothetical protein
MTARVSSFSRSWAAELGMFVKMRVIVLHTDCSEPGAILNRYDSCADKATKFLNLA